MNFFSPLSNHPPNIKGKDDSLWKAVLWIAISCGLVLRVMLRTDSTLWEDEIIAATHAVQPLWRVVVNSLVNDMHPPLYFIELHVWSLFSSSDPSLIANSIFFSFIALASLFIVFWRLENAARALVITAVFAVLPVSLWMAQEVRMYAFMSVLLIWMFYFTQRSFVLPSEQRRPYLWTALFALAIVYSHAIGFVAVLFFGLYAASHLATRRAAGKDWRKWLDVFGGVGVLSIPVLLADLYRDADMPPLKHSRDFIDWMASVVTGGGYQTSSELELTGLLTFFATLAAGLYVPRTRRITLCFLIGPLLLCLAVGFVARPLFKTDFFSNFTSPFLAIVIGHLLAVIPVRQKGRTLILGIVLTALGSMGIANRLTINKNEGYYRSAIDKLKEYALPGDTIWVPQTDIFWGVLWYSVGPDWGSPLSIAPPHRADSGWHKLQKLLGLTLVEQLELAPKSQTVMTKSGITILTGISSEPVAEQASRLWLITYVPRSDLPAHFVRSQIGPMLLYQSFSDPPLQLNLYERR